MFRTPERDVHVHLWVTGSDDVTRHLEFRDRLRASEADRRAYSEPEAPARRARVGRHQRLRGREGRADCGDPLALTCHPAGGEAALASSRRRARRAEPVPAALPLRAPRVRAARHELIGVDARGFARRIRPRAHGRRGSLASLPALRLVAAGPGSARPDPRRAPGGAEIVLPPRGKPLRDKIVLRLIAVNRALHFVVLGAVAVTCSCSPRTATRCAPGLPRDRRPADGNEHRPAFG